MERMIRAFVLSFIGGLFLMSVVKARTEASSAKLDTEQSKIAFDYLNEVRANPSAFSESIGVNLNKVEKRAALVWDDRLAKVAEDKAKDMIKRNYFSHVDPDGDGINIKLHEAGYELNETFYEKRSHNYFESIQGGVMDGKEMINDLIIDEGERDKGHRKHLLGIGDWNKNMTDCGIAMVKDPNYMYRVITVVIIAKHDF